MMIKYINKQIHMPVTEVRGRPKEKSRGMSNSSPCSKFSPLIISKVHVHSRCRYSVLLHLLQLMSGCPLWQPTVRSFVCSSWRYSVLLHLLQLMSGCPLWQPTVRSFVCSSWCLRRGDVLSFVLRGDEERCIHLSSLLLFLPSFSPFLSCLQVAVRRRLLGVLGRGGYHFVWGVCHRLSVSRLVVGGTVPPFMACFPTGETGLRLVTVLNRDLGLSSQGGKTLGDLPVQLDLQGPIPRLDGCPPPHDMVGARHHQTEVLENMLHG